MLKTTAPTCSSDISFGVLGGALIACALAFAVLGSPALPPAPIVLLGVPSPLTGMTRSFVALAAGHLTQSFAFHPLGPLCAVACVLAVVNLVHVRRTGRRLAIVDRVVTLPYAPWILATLFGLVWIRQIVVYR